MIHDRPLALAGGNNGTLGRDVLALVLVALRV
jgi:hypothetical protein